MNDSKTSILIPILMILLTVMGCDSQVSVSADESESLSMEFSKQGTSMLHSNAPFPNLNQGFNINLTPWVDKSVEGPLGWCGTISLADGGSDDVEPSAGKDFAYVSNGGCNDFWSGQFGPAYTSGAASGPNPELLSSTFPESGFVQELDIYLDPTYPSGVSTTIFNSDGAFSPTGDEDVVFTYANSVCLVCDLASFQPVYFAISVVKDDGDLSVAGYEVEEEGWYTFRQVFASNVQGKLTVEFQLLNSGRVLHAKSIDTTFLSGQPTDVFDAADLGSGYIWFVSVADGLSLPIDENRMRPGK